MTGWDLLNLRFLSQPATFVRRSALEQVGGLDTTFECVFDFELWLRLTRIAALGGMPEVLATTRWHPETKTQSQRLQVADELVRVVHKAVGEADRWAEERRWLLGGVYLKAASIYLEHPSHLSQAARYWWRAFRCSPAHRRQLLWLLVAKGRWHARRILSRPRSANMSPGLHWSEWPSPWNGQADAQ
jgi:hypothetical protein